MLARTVPEHLATLAIEYRLFYGYCLERAAHHRTQTCPKMLGPVWTPIGMANLILIGFCFFLRTMEFVALPVSNVVVDLATSQIVVSLDRTKT